MEARRGAAHPHRLGYALTPALQRFWAAGEPSGRAERLLGTLGGIEVFAVCGNGRSVTIGASRTQLSSGEGVVLRERSGASSSALRATSQLQQYTGDPEPLLRALRTFAEVYILNLPADDPAAETLRELGGSVRVRQHEMLLEL